MTLKAIDVLQARSKGKGWFMMSEAASIDKVRRAPNQPEVRILMNNILFR
jgi:alkaline phosphatase